MYQNCKNAGHTKLPSILSKKMLRHPNVFHSEPSVLSKDAPPKFHLSATFGLSFMISSVASTSSQTFYIYLITKLRIHNLKSILTEFIKILVTFLVPKSLDVSWKILDLSGRGKKSSVFYLTIRGHSFIQLYLTSVRKNSSKELLKIDKFLLALYEFKKICNFKSF